MLRRSLLAAVTAAALTAAAAVTAAPSMAVAPSVKGGKFEVTCKPHAIPDQAIDPIVSPGAESAHLHTFFGSKALTSTSTPASIQASTADTTCVLPDDHAAYWIPAACNGPCQPVDGGDPERGPFANVIQPVKIFAYYFGVPASQAVEQQFSPDLEIIGGDAHATGPYPNHRIIGFHCGNGGSHHSPVRTYPYDCTAANGVTNTDGVVAVVTFPYCGPVGGTPTNYGDSTGTCVAPDVTYPQVQIHVHYGLNATGYQTGSTLNFSSGAYWTLHGDWMNGWNQAKLQALVSGCLDIDKDCGFLTQSNPGPS